MGGISALAVLEAPQPTTPFEAFVIQKLEQHTEILNSHSVMLEQHTAVLAQHSAVLGPHGPIMQSIYDLSESIAFVADQMVTREILDEILDQKLDEKLDQKLDQKLAKFATKEDLSRVEHRLKSYIDDKVVIEGLKPMIRKEDEKVDAVIDTLEEGSVIDHSQSRELKTHGPFPQPV